MKAYFFLSGFIILLVVGGYLFWQKTLDIVDGRLRVTDTTGAVTQDLPKTAQADSMVNTTSQQLAGDSKDSSSTYMSNTQVILTTTKGDITLELFANDAPKTVENFVSLVNKKFYDGVIFHRVISGFMIQGGDPTGTGTGGPGYKFVDELNSQTESYKRGYVRGVLAMANAGPNTNGSQFFIMHKDTPLPHAYTIFGRVVSGIEVVDSIAETETNPINDKPLDDVVITQAVMVK